MDKEKMKKLVDKLNAEFGKHFIGVDCKYWFHGTKNMEWVTVFFDIKVFEMTNKNLIEVIKKIDTSFEENKITIHAMKIEAQSENTSAIQYVLKPKTND